MGVSGRFRGASGTPPPTVCPETGDSGSLPLIRPCGATFPRGGRQGLQGRDSSLPGKGGSGRSRRGGGTPPYVWGDMETPWGLRGHPFPGRRAVGAGHARPGGLRRQASMVRSAGRGLDPSAEVDGGASLRGASGTPPPTVCPGMGGDGRPRRGGGTPPYVWGDMETLWGLRGHPFPGHRTVGAGHARPGGLRRQASMVRSVGRGLDPSAGGYPGDGCWREVSRGVGDAAPYGLPGNGRQREPAPHPALRGHLPPRGKARAVVGGGASCPLPRQLVLGAELEGQAVVPAV